MAVQNNKWALVTGASSGIGKAFAERFAKEGWNVALLARSGDKLKSIASDLERQHQVKTFVITADLSHDNLYRKIYEEVRGAGIVIDCLVNNAGFGVIGSFMGKDLERQLEMIDVNVKALVALTHLFLPGMVSQQSGTIINVSSTAGFQPMPYFAIYSSTKTFVTNFSESIAKEFEDKGIRVISLCPGRTESNFGEVAGFHHHPLDKRPKETSEAVVDTAFRAMKTKKVVVISGFPNWLIRFAEHFVPRSLTASVLKTAYRKLGYSEL